MTVESHNYNHWLGRQILKWIYMSSNHICVAKYSAITFSDTAGSHMLFMCTVRARS